MSWSLNKVTYPDGGLGQITYDTSNRPQTITLPQGTVVTLQHDISGRETHRTTSTGEFRDLTYGPGDRIETMTDNTGTTTYHYDAAGRFSGMTYPSGGSVMYDRDVLDRTTDVRVKTTATASEIHTHYDYDQNGNLLQITDPNGGVTGYSYDDADRLQQRVLPNGVVTSYGYDSRDRVLSVVHRNAGNVVLASVVYERSASGEPTKITREDGTYTRVEYDSALRVKKESEFDATDVLVAETSYGYDADGNRTSKTTLTGNETYSYAAGFKLTGISGTAGNEVYGHDAGGRLTSVTRGGVARTIEYDSMDHITKVLDGGIEVERYTFDGMGRRVSADDGTGVRRFLTAPNLGDGYESPQAVTDAGGNMVAAFVYAGEHPIMKITMSGVEYLLADSMGSVIGKSNSTGASTASIKYTGFGEVESAVGASAGIDPTVGAEPRFQGMTLDGSTGLYFVRARSYDARTGRFVSKDPLGWIVRWLAEGAHPYVFANDNPRLWRDPTGLFLELMTAVDIQALFPAVGMMLLHQTVSINGQQVADIWFGSTTQRQDLANDLKVVLGTARGQAMLAALAVQKQYIKVTLMPFSGDVKANSDEMSITFDPLHQGFYQSTAGVCEYTSRRKVAHELGHAVFGTKDDYYGGALPSAQYERDRMLNVMENENPITRELGEPDRLSYRRLQPWEYPLEGPDPDCPVVP